MTGEPPGFDGCAVCRSEEALALIQGRWKVPIICRLWEGTKRFGALQRVVGGIRHKVLTEQLRELERDGIVIRTVLAEQPTPKVEYKLTVLGEELAALVGDLDTWSRQHLPPGNAEVRP